MVSIYAGGYGGFAPVNYAKVEFDKLRNHLAKKAYANMHLRFTRQRRGVRELHYVNLLKADSNGIVHGHLAGPAVDIEYNIIASAGGATFQIVRSTNSFSEVLELLEKEKLRILSRIDQEQDDMTRVRYKEGNYYVRRNGKVGHSTAALLEALAAGVFPASIVQSLMNGGFIVIKGRGKKAA